MRTHALAPQSPLFLGLTVALIVLPAGFFLAPAWGLEPLLRGVGAFVVLVSASVWFWWRPGRFELDDGALHAVFPLRRRSTRLADVVRAEVLDWRAFQGRYPRAMRVGAGGLWGGFGWLWTKNGWVEFYISRLDGLVLVERRGTIPLLISPVDPEGLAAALGWAVGGR